MAGISQFAWSLVCIVNRGDPPSQGNVIEPRNSSKVLVALQFVQRCRSVWLRRLVCSCLSYKQHLLSPRWGCLVYSLAALCCKEFPMVFAAASFKQPLSSTTWATAWWSFSRFSLIQAMVLVSITAINKSCFMGSVCALVFRNRDRASAV